MSKNKYDFISDLLKNKKFSSSQRERLLRLISLELKNENSDSADLEQRVKNLEELLGSKSRTDVSESFTSVDSIFDESISVDNLSDLPSKTLLDELKKEIFFNTDEKSKSQNSLSLTNQIESDKDSPVVPKYISPRNVYKFLHAYNQSPVLKTTCHLMDEDDLEVIKRKLGLETYIFKDHLSAIVKSYNEIEKRFYVTGQLKSLLRGYITGLNYEGKTNPWSLDKIRLNWSADDLIKWSDNNKGIPPNIDSGFAEDLEVEGFVFPPLDLKSKGEKIQTFSELTLHFKSLFHINESNSLFNHVNGINKKKGWSEKIDFDLDHKDFWVNQELFTYVEKVLSAYEKIILLILDKCQSTRPRVKVSFKSINQNIIFSIHQLDGIYAKTLDDTLTRGIGKTYNSLIENQINGFCDLVLCADFDHQHFAEVELWSQNSHHYPLKHKKLETFQGVEHKMIFQR